jgi:hypothetical protein
VACVTATSLEEVKGVGGKATRPSASKPARASSKAACGSLGSSSAYLPKNESRAVPVYSG